MSKINNDINKISNELKSIKKQLIKATNFYDVKLNALKKMIEIKKEMPFHILRSYRKISKNLNELSKNIVEKDNIIDSDLIKKLNDTLSKLDKSIKEINNLKKEN